MYRSPIHFTIFQKLNRCHKTYTNIADSISKIISDGFESEGSYMKINNVGPSGMNPYKKQLNQLNELKHASSRKDKIEISTTAKEMQHSSQFVAERQAKVEKIKLSLENGTYSVNVNEIAKSMINFYKKK